MNCLALVLLALVLSGCITANTIGLATSEHTRYLHDKVKRVEKAALTPDSKLVLWVDGQMAGAGRSGKYTISASLSGLEPGRAFLSGHGGERDFASVRRTAIVQGWNEELMRSGDLRTVAIAPLVVLPGHQSAYDQHRRLQFTGLEAAERTVYVVRNAENDLNLMLVYAEKGRVPERIFFDLETKYVRVPHRYYLLLWLPVTIPADAATLPLQLLMWPLVASIKC